MLRYLHYREENDIYIFTNENMEKTFKGTVTMPTQGVAYTYDVWNNRLQNIETESHSEGTTIFIELPPYKSLVVVFDQADGGKLEDMFQPEKEMLLTDGWSLSLSKSIEYPNFHDAQMITTLENIGFKYPDFSGFMRYENAVELPKVQKASLLITDAFEGVEVFVNNETVGIQVVPPYIFDISKHLKEGKNLLRIEVANTLERERHYAPLIPGDFFAMLLKPPILSPSGIVGEVKLTFQ
jgi:hypothetical protein